MPNSKNFKILISLSLSTVMSASILTGCQSVPTTGESSSASAVVANPADTASLVQNLMLVEENHYVMHIGEGDHSANYILDSYIVPFQQPYYILVRKQDGAPFIKRAAVAVAIEYIKPRGCTEPLKRREELDKQNADGSAYLIGVAC